MPPPRFHLVRYAGVLAPGARLRARIVPEPPEGNSGALVPEAGEGSDEMPVPASGAAVLAPRAEPAPADHRPYPWAELMQRVSPLTCWSARAVTGR